MPLPPPLRSLLCRASSASSRRRPDAEFRPPLEPGLKTAVLAPGFRPSRRVRVFPAGWNDEAARFAPAVLAASPADLLALARRWNPSWDRPTHALVALTHASDSPLAEPARDLLWDTFGLPVFEYLLAEDGALLAAECDAHDGLHLLASAAHPSGWDRLAAPCSCGNSAPRLVPAAAPVHEPGQVLATSAR